MKARKLVGAAMAAALGVTLVIGSPALGAGPGGGGGGGAGGGGGGPGGGGGGGGGEPPDSGGSLYADLVIALRAVDGTPILKKFVVPPTEEEPEETVEYCVQPISREQVPGVVETTNPVDGSTVWVLPLQGEWITNPPAGGLPVEELEACDPKPQYAMFVTEVELERLNLARTSDDVLAAKLAEVETKLRFADEIGLDGAGRLTVDGTAMDASPEYAAIYGSLMRTGTLPGLPAAMAGPPAQVDIFDAWDLAAAAVGTASGKEVPINVDTIEYYNRSIGFPPDDAYVSPWGADFIRSEDPDNAGVEMTTGERFVDYSGFSYTRSAVFRGSVTWLDVPNLKWEVDRITDVVSFNNKDLTDTELTGVRAFAQLADDVRAVILYYHDHEVIPGFYMDPVGQDTTTEQEAAIVDPAVDLGDLPASVFRTLPFEMTASLFNPWGGTLIDEGRLRITVDATDALAEGDVTATAKADGQTVPFTVDADGNLVGWWGPDTGFPVQPGYNVSTTFDVTIAGTAPVGDYIVKLELVDVDDLADVLAVDSGVLAVSDNVATVLWGERLPKLATQGTSVKIPVTVYSPEAGTGVLTLTIAGPGDDETTEEDESLAAGDVKVYTSDGTDMVAMPLTLNAEDELVGTWTATLAAGYTPVTWYATVAEGAPVGNYTFGVALADVRDGEGLPLEGGNTLAPIVVAVAAPDTHGEIPPDAGEDTTPPVVTIVPDGDLGSTASFTFTADDVGTIFTCMLEKDGVVTEDWASCHSPKTYTDLEPGQYVFSVRGTRGELVSEVATHTWTVQAPDPGDTTAPTVTIEPVAGTVPGSTATFMLTANESATFECMLTKSGRVLESWAPCTSPAAYTDLKPATYVLSVRATDTAGNTSVAATFEWTVTKGGAGSGKPPKSPTPGKPAKA